jgi:RES domain
VVRVRVEDGDGYRVTEILDLRDPDSLQPLGPTPDDLSSSIRNHVRCQRIGQAAHQVGLHGIIAPSATGLGHTLALFDAHLPVEELPTLVRDEIWSGLPPDPRNTQPTDGWPVAGELDSADSAADE